MIKQLKKWSIQLVTGANVATVIVMLLVGFSDRIHPADHPLLSTIGMAFPILLVINMAFLLFWLIFKWTRAWIPVAGYIFAYVPISIYMPINANVSHPDEALKLVTYNVCSFGGNYKYAQGFEKVRDYLIDEKADIVCLQEDNDSWRRYLSISKSVVSPITIPWCCAMTRCVSTVWASIPVSLSSVGNVLTILLLATMAVRRGGCR